MPATSTTFGLVVLCHHSANVSPWVLQGKCCLVKHALLYMSQTHFSAQLIGTYINDLSSSSMPNHYVSQSRCNDYVVHDRLDSTYTITKAGVATLPVLGRSQFIVSLDPLTNLYICTHGCGKTIYKGKACVHIIKVCTLILLSNSYFLNLITCLWRRFSI